MSSSSSPYKQRDHIARGQKHSTPLGTTIFVTMRFLDPILQYKLLATTLGATILQSIGSKAVLDNPPIHTGTTLIDALGLSPYRLLLLSMAVAGSAKQIYNQLVTSEEALPLNAAIPLGFYPGFLSTMHSLLAISPISGSLPRGKATDTRLFVSAVLFVTGILIEALSETQRKKFKADARNRGKLCTDGWWSIVRHINFTGFILWRTAFGLVAGGWGLTGGLGSFIFYFCAMNLGAIDSLSSYATRKYGEQWEEYKRKTPYKLFPGVW